MQTFGRLHIQSFNKERLPFLLYTLTSEHFQVFLVNIFSLCPDLSLDVDIGQQVNHDPIQDSSYENSHILCQLTIQF